MSTHPSNDRLITRLITVLSEEMQMYNELLLALREKQASIIEGKVQELREAVEKEQSIISRTKAVSETREAFFKEVSEALSQEGDIKNLGQLIQVVESTYAERLSDIHKSLQEIVQKVMLANEENRYLLNYSIKFVREAARELIRSSDQFKVYSAEGAGTKTPAATSSFVEGRI
ncbi:MAG: flagellar protein FlgN [Candidatus Marinimicrobia bacterium]|nr:flagellar protein FlgN [Candidatus Neomarinimicrobiota bacterium]